MAAAKKKHETWVDGRGGPPRRIGAPNVRKAMDMLTKERWDAALKLSDDQLPAYVSIAKEPNPQALRKRIISPEFLDAADRWDPRRHGNLLILGDTGVGKSALGAVIFRRLLGQALSDSDQWPLASGMVWADAEELSRDCTTHGRGHGECKSFLEALGATLLFLDEVGSEPEIQTVTSLIAMRYKRLRPTVIMSGRSTKDLTELYKAPLVRKMLDTQGRPGVLLEHMDPKGRARAVWPKVGDDGAEMRRRLGEKDD